MLTKLTTKFLSILIALLIATPILGQSNENDPAKQRLRITAIDVFGNKKTKAEVVLREMETNVGDTATIEQLEIDRRRIESLGLFTRVEMRFTERADGVGVIILVSEQWYFFPFPIVFFNDKETSLKKLSYGAGIVNTNFRGRAEILQLMGWLGYNPGAILSYRNPWILGDARLFTEMRFFYTRVRNKSFDIQHQKVTEKQIGGYWSIGKRLTLKTSLQVGLGYREIRLVPSVPNATLNPSGIDRLPSVSITFIRDNRDLIWYPSRGSYTLLSAAQTQKPGDSDTDYSQFAINYRRYIPVFANIVFAGRFAGDLTRGNLPIYERLVFGYLNRLRGYFSQRFEGENRMLAGAEIRFPIIPIHYFNLDSRVLGAYGQNLKFGVSAGIFVEAGSLWLQNRNSRIGPQLSTGPFGTQTRPKRWLSSVGFGLHFHVPYVNLARLELAVNDHRETEIILDTGVAF